MEPEQQKTPEKKKWKLPTPIRGIIKEFMPNPKRAGLGEQIATMDGMLRWIIVYGIVLICGMLLSFALHIYLPTTGMKTYGPIYNNPALKITIPELLILMLVSLYQILYPGVRFIYQWLPVTGSLYALLIGFLFGTYLINLGLHSLWLIPLFLLVSAILIAIPILYYRLLKKELPKHYSKVIFGLFFLHVLVRPILAFIATLPLVGKVAVFVQTILLHPVSRELIGGGQVILSMLTLFIAVNTSRTYAYRQVNRRFQCHAGSAVFYISTMIMLNLITWMCSYL